MKSSKIASAFVGAALGDALGWPIELRGGRVAPPSSTPKGEFVSWTRRAGGRFYLHEETIRAGEYSDDTQLLLCTARSILTQPEDWWHYLAHVELPAWTSYERGGGGAVKRAAASWLKGKRPWIAAPSERHRYFNAGGNGVAMRILPHCVADMDSRSFEPVAQSVVLNGVLTHGHPRALVGALAYAYALWIALRKVDQVSYGEIIERLLADSSVWSGLPSPVMHLDGWQGAADSEFGSYESAWRSVCEEMQVLLDQCFRGIRQGAIALDGEVLREIGAFDKSVNGSGTITAAAAVFLSSRYAVDPNSGLFAAATARGTDSDTVASMTGALLGSLVTAEWSQRLAEQLQDRDYIVRIAAALSSDGLVGDVVARSQPAIPRKLSAFESQLKKLQPGGSIMVLDGREAACLEVEDLPTRTRNQPTRWKLLTTDGQTLYFKKQRRAAGGTTTSHPQESASSLSLTEQPAPQVVRLATRIYVRDLYRSLLFYTKALGLHITNQTEKSATLNSSLQLVTNGVAPSDTSVGIMLYVETRQLPLAHANAGLFGRLVDDIRESGNRRYFVCVDPDGTRVEVSERTQP